jgi:hypothetical protein
MAGVTKGSIVIETPRFSSASTHVFYDAHIRTCCTAYQTVIFLVEFRRNWRVAYAALSDVLDERTRLK